MGAEIPDGAVIVARAVVNSSLWSMRPEDCKLAITCICMANWMDKKWFDGRQQITIARGQFVSSFKSLSKASQLSLQTVRTSVLHLKNSEFLTLKVTQRYTLFTLPKYEHYQDLTKYYNTDSNTRLTRAQHEPNTNQRRVRRERRGEPPRVAPQPDRTDEAAASIVKLLVDVNCRGGHDQFMKYATAWCAAVGPDEALKRLHSHDIGGGELFWINDTLFPPPKTKPARRAAEAPPPAPPAPPLSDEDRKKADLERQKAVEKQLLAQIDDMSPAAALQTLNDFGGDKLPGHVQAALRKRAGGGA